MKRTHPILLAVAFLAIFSHSYGQNSDLKVSKSSEMSISGTSTLHSWTCNVTDVSGTVKVDEKILKKGEFKKGDKIAAVSITVPVLSIKSERGETMEQKMYNALKYEENPNITFSLTDNQITSPGKETFAVEAKGNLTIAGKTKAIALPVAGKRDASGKYSFEGSYKLNMKDYDMEPPTAMFGQIVTGEEVEISFKLIVED
ncbi:YceI family protein [uncultured Imperialibacter sp.]|uniref:YceI family protein n=1 Tax=uncultured Imperialibacter sp. TaxID=1672639 RepID=UPI0030DDC1D7|tara:strand:- start:926 stop:1528 length:603 start_codon:yes stop_codon:yes gene_type:complete